MSYHQTFSRSSSSAILLSNAPRSPVSWASTGSHLYSTCSSWSSWTRSRSCLPRGWATWEPSTVVSISTRCCARRSETTKSASRDSNCSKSFVLKSNASRAKATSRSSQSPSMNSLSKTKWTAGSTTWPIWCNDKSSGMRRTNLSTNSDKERLTRWLRRQSKSMDAKWLHRPRTGSHSQAQSAQGST